MPQAEAEAEAEVEAELSSDWVRAELNYWFISCPWMLLPAKSWTISLCRSRLTRLLSLRTHMIYSHLFLYCFFIISEFLYFVFCILYFIFSPRRVFWTKVARRLINHAACTFCIFRLFRLLRLFRQLVTVRELNINVFQYQQCQKEWEELAESVRYSHVANTSQLFTHNKSQVSNL